MPFYKGKTRDGSDIEEVRGAYVNPDNDNEWSSKPYPSQKRHIKCRDSVLNYMNGIYSLNDVYLQIIAKNCKLTFRLRQYVLSHFDDKGNIKE